MSKVIILLVALLALGSCSLTRNHQTWYTASRSIALSGLPYADSAWNYCDFKCTYLEKYYPGKDFVVIPFSAGSLSPNFAACYVATGAAISSNTSVSTNGTSTSTGSTTNYALWNTVASNTFYESACGGDKEDYYTQTTGANPKYTVSGNIQGVGIGT